MKKVLMLICLVALTIGCKQQATVEGEKTEVASTSGVEGTVAKSDKIEQLFSEMLVPMEIAQEGAEKITDKYGIDFGGTCYACDVAEIIVDGEMINLMNACDVQTQISYKITKVEEKDKIITVSTPLNEFVFERIDDYPMYKLTVKGQAIDKEHFRTAGFYTLKSKLETFTVHDCGDFEG
ncbi:hypothetical protein LNQ81_02235 [Myroides sp. M-43]|uniref:hypothetical protein n=1 Tax=Myroides oncorhynchi TaxID=2893756 RepID=UPI001E3B4A13|nr:hypothetical protein [Myroides oncorhynchi]MCC9041535.1 hypothetical protein [Myroides oncorhynchi]